MKQVLVIEDDENNMELISYILECHGYDILKAGTGENGLQTALIKQPDFIILDIQLPDTDGFEVLKQIRASEAICHIPVIAMTSYAMAGDRERMLAAGCNGYIEKPIDPDLVVNQIQKAIGESG